MIYVLGFDGVIAQEDARGAMHFVAGAEDGLDSLLRAGHDVVVWSVRSGPLATAAEREGMEAFLQGLIEKWGGRLRIADPRRDGPKPLGSIYIDTKAERFVAGATPGDGNGIGWAALARRTRKGAA